MSGEKLNIMKITPEERFKLARKLRENPWLLSSDLFGDPWEMNDFEMRNYTFFLDNVRSLENLLKGLCELSPMADDALRVAEHMNHQDFYEFKLALAYERLVCERQQEDSKMPVRYDTLVIPRWFVYALPLAEKCVVPLGATIIRLMEFESNL